jgi:hypothetical protein
MTRQLTGLHDARQPIGIQVITNDGYLQWYCPGDEEEECGALLSAHLDEVEYHEMPATRKPGRGAVIALPTCHCGTQTFLKADYTMKELYKALIRYEEDGMWAYVLPTRYVHNLHVHFLLYQHGKAAFAPALEMMPQSLLDHPSFAGVKPSTVQALWYGYLSAREVAPHELATSVLAQIAAPAREE